jgi:hypothetical protein
VQKQTKLVLILVALCLIDLVIPIPILGLMLVYVVLEKPVWFRDLVSEVYGA